MINTKDRIRELAEAAGLRVLGDGEEAVQVGGERVFPNRCWVDASVRCQYGSPEGQYILRPEVFCHEGCCQTFAHHCETALTQKELDDEIAEELRGNFESNSVPLSSELYEIVNSSRMSDEEALALRLAADILKESSLDCRVLLARHIS